MKWPEFSLNSQEDVYFMLRPLQTLTPQSHSEPMVGNSNKGPLARFHREVYTCIEAWLKLIFISLSEADMLWFQDFFLLEKVTQYFTGRAGFLSLV